MSTATKETDALPVAVPAAAPLAFASVSPGAAAAMVFFAQGRTAPGPLARLAGRWLRKRTPPPAPCCC